MQYSKNQQLIDDILALPYAPNLVDRLKTKLEEEKRERHNFYNAITEQQKAEFINGEIITHSPVKKIHNEISGNLYKILSAYVIEYDLGFVGIEKVLTQFTRNDYEPDLCFFEQSTARKFSADQTLFPVPNLVIEVLSKSTEQRDRGIKFIDYQAHAVSEYWIVNPIEKSIEQFYLEQGKYDLLLKSDSGSIACKTIKNLTFPIQAAFDSKHAQEIVKKILLQK